MKRLAIFFCCLTALLVRASAVHGQEPLSFEPGGKEACAKALGAPMDASPSFVAKCAQRDLVLQKARIDALARSLEKRSPEERVAFNALLVSFYSFRESRIAEACGGSDPCTVDQVREKVHVNQDFLRLAEGFADADPAALSAEGLPTQDAAMNLDYQMILASLPPTCPSAQAGCLSQAVVRETQRDWIRYRDAWVTFGALRWPKVPGGGWLAFLTRERTNQIESSFESLLQAPTPATETPKNHVN